jgi:hypothetical protein
MTILNWILLRLAFLMMMRHLGVRLTPMTVLVLLVGLGTINQLVFSATVAAQHLMINRDHLQGPLNAQMVMDIGTLVLAMGGVMITTASVVAYILGVNV